VIEEHNFNDIGKLFHNELPLYLIHAITAGRKLKQKRN